MKLVSENCLMIVAQALDEYRQRICDEIDTGKISQAGKYDYENYLMQVEKAIDTVEDEYEALRKENPSMMPFSELLKNKR